MLVSGIGNVTVSRHPPQPPPPATAPDSFMAVTARPAAPPPPAPSPPPPVVAPRPPAPVSLVPGAAIVPVSATLAANEALARRRQAGKPVLPMAFGEAGLPVPPILRDALGAVTGGNDYGPVAGR